MVRGKKTKKWMTNEIEDELTDLISSTQTAFTEKRSCFEALDYKINFKAKNEKQKGFYKMIQEKEIVFCQGAAGTGKSFVALSAALDLLKKDDNPYKQILLLPQTVQSEMELGYLRGNVDDKISPFLDATWYNIKKVLTLSSNKKSSNDILDGLRKCDYIIYNHISFLRGATFDNVICIIDESQNYTKSAIKTILTRIGTNSKYIFMSDVEQCDNDKIKKNADIGIKYAMEKLKDVDGVGIVEFENDDIVRNPIIGKILNMWNE